MIFLTPGPTKTQSKLPLWMSQALTQNVASQSHRSLWFEELFSDICKKLKKLCNIPQEYEIAFSGSATEIWERSIQNLVNKESFHIINGEFSQRHSNFSKMLGKNNVEYFIDLDFNGSFSQIKIPLDAELICLAQNETSTGMMIPSTEIAKVKENYPEKLISLDIVSAIPQINTDFSLIDVAYFSVQKGFGLPAGLGVVILSPRAINRSIELQKIHTVGSYHSFPNLIEHAKKYQTPETPNVLAMWLLSKALDEYLEEGIFNLRKRTLNQFHILTDELSKLGMNSMIQSKDYQSSSVLALSAFGKAKEVRKKLEQAGIQVGSGYGKYADAAIRVANFPMHTSEDHQRLISALKEICRD